MDFACASMRAGLRPVSESSNGLCPPWGHIIRQAWRLFCAQGPPAARETWLRPGRKKCLKCCGWQISPAGSGAECSFFQVLIWPALSVAAWPGKDKSQWLLTRDANANRDKGIDAPVMALRSSGCFTIQFCSRFLIFRIAQ